MPSVVFDIETIGIPFDELEQAQQEYYTKSAKSPEEAEQMKSMTALWVPTAKIVTIAMMNPATGKGKVYYSAGDTTPDTFEEDGATFIAGTEQEILEWFWDDIKRFDQFISFNGRSFDGPMLMLRSAFLGIAATKNLVPYRYDHKFHCDLLDQLTFYGAHRRYSLDTFVQAFGIPSPKEGDVTGAKVTEAYAEGKYTEIAQYCWRDVIATGELWKKWDSLLKF